MIEMMDYDESKKIQREIDELIDEISEIARNDKSEKSRAYYYATQEALELAKRLCELNRAPF